MRHKRIPFYPAFVASYLAFDLIGMAIDLATWGHHQGEGYESYAMMFFLYIAHFLFQSIIALGAWLVYRKCKDKWTVLLTAAVLLIFNLVFMTLVHNIDIESHRTLAFCSTLILIIPGAMTSNPCILRLLSSMEVDPAIWFTIRLALSATVCYTIVLFSALLLSGPHTQLSATREEGSSAGHDLAGEDMNNGTYDHRNNHLGN
jgi:hypothetical protein